MQQQWGYPAPVARRLGELGMRFVARNLGFDAEEAAPVRLIGRISPRPVLLIHGAADRLVPPSEAYALYAAAGPPKELWLVPAASAASRRSIPAACWHSGIGCLRRRPRPRSPAGRCLMADRTKFSNPDLDRSPFYFNRGQGRVGVLLIHGWTGSPPEMRPVGEYLAARGLVVHGLSMGGLLTLYLGATDPRPIAGLISYSTPIHLTDWRRPLLPVLVHLVHWVDKGNDYDCVDPTTPTRLADYRVYPSIAALNLSRLIAQTRVLLPRIQAPILVMQGLHDGQVQPRSAQYIYDHVRSVDKTLVWLGQSGHCITVDQEREQVWQRTADWIAAHVPAEAVPAPGPAAVATS